MLDFYSVSGAFDNAQCRLQIDESFQFSLILDDGVSGALERLYS